MKILDAGVYGVICPMINTPEEAEALVQACHANADLLVMPMIETTEALKNLDAILGSAQRHRT